MTVRPIRLYGDPVLRQPCPPITRFDDALARLVDDLVETCRLPGRAGLAAPQIGIQRRVFSYNLDGVEGYVINPELALVEGPTQDDPEGCLSLPGLSFPTVRAERVVIRGVDLDQQVFEMEASGFLARCFQHETDHLDGHLYIDRLEGDVRKAALEVVRAQTIDGSFRPSDS